PSLLPRTFIVQGILSGFALAAGYGVGVFFVWLWLYLQIPKPKVKIQRVSKQVTAVVVAIVVATFLWRATVWQNSIRQLMDMEPDATAYPWRVALIAILTGVALIAAARGLRNLWKYVDRQISRVVPPRVSRVMSAFVVVGLLLIGNHVIAWLALNAAGAMFAHT